MLENGFLKGEARVSAEQAKPSDFNIGQVHSQVSATNTVPATSGPAGQPTKAETVSQAETDAFDKAAAKSITLYERIEALDLPIGWAGVNIRELAGCSGIMKLVGLLSVSVTPSPSTFNSTSP